MMAVGKACQNLNVVLTDKILMIKITRRKKLNMKIFMNTKNNNLTAISNLREIQAYQQTPIPQSILPRINNKYI